MAKNTPRGAPNHDYAHSEIHPYVKPQARGVPDNTNYYPSPGNANQWYPKPGEGPRAMSDTGIPEAPTDGTQYGRQNMAWTPIALPPADAPSDNYTYGRRNFAWAPVPEEAPDDAIGYVRMGRLWVPQAVAAVQEAPLDGRGYMRQSAAWQPLPDTPDGSGIPDAPNDGNIYARQSLGWVAVEQPALGAEITLEDGAADVVLPGWRPLLADQLTAGTAVTVNADGSVTCNVDGEVIIQVAIDVTHNWGSSVIFGFSIDDAVIEELGRVRVESNEPVRVSARYERDVHVGAKLALYISSDFEWSQFSWANGIVQMFAEGAAGVPEAPNDGSYYTRHNAAWAATTKATMGLGNVDNTSDVNKPVSTATQTALNAKLGDAPSDGKQYARKNAAWSEVTSNGGGAGGAGLKGVQVFKGTSANTIATYTPTAGATKALVILQNGGGGGGGCGATAAGQVAAAGGGAGGAWAVLLVAQLAASYAVEAGRQGGNAQAGANNGTAGGVSKFGGISLGTAGGLPGQGCAAVTPPAAGGAGGSNANGQVIYGTETNTTVLINGNGAMGSNGLAIGTTLAIGGAGGAGGFMGAPALGLALFNASSRNYVLAAQLAGQGYGSGGCGAVNTDSAGSGACASAPGGPGFVLILEF